MGDFIETPVGCARLQATRCSPVRLALSRPPYPHAWLNNITEPPKRPISSHRYNIRRLCSRVSHSFTNEHIRLFLLSPHSSATVQTTNIFEDNGQQNLIAEQSRQLNNAEGPVESPNNLIRWPAAARKYPHVKLRPINPKKMYNISIDSQKTRDLIVRRFCEETSCCAPFRSALAFYYSRFNSKVSEMRSCPRKNKLAGN